MKHTAQHVGIAGMKALRLPGLSRTRCTIGFGAGLGVACIGEALALQWGDLDFEAREIRAERAVSNAGVMTPRSRATGARWT